MNNSLEPSKPIDIKKIVKNFWGYRYLCGILCVIALFIAFIINKTTTPRYSNFTSFAIVDNPKSDLMNANEFFRGIDIFGGNKDAENELAFLSSFSLAFSTLEKLDVFTSYYSEEKIFSFLPFTQSEDLYRNSPYEVITNNIYPQAVGARFYIKILNQSEYILHIEEEEPVYLYNYIQHKTVDVVPNINLNQKFKFGEQVKTEFANFKVILKDTNYVSDKDNESLDYFIFNNLVLMAKYYQKSLVVSADFTLNSIVYLILEDHNYWFIHDYLNEFTNTYIEQDLWEKNNIAISTIDFIDNQISTVSDTLSTVEKKLQRFRSQNQVTDLSFQGKQLLEQINALEQKKAESEMFIKYYRYINDYFNKSSNISDLMAPSVMGVNDPMLNSLIEQIQALNSERVKLLDDNNTKNLYLRNVDLQINNLKSTIKENIRNNLKTSQITYNDINSRLNKLNNELRVLPGTERQLLGIKRKFDLNDAIYTYLLQRRAEAQIAKASNRSNIEIVDQARVISPQPIAPKGKLNYALALFIAFFLTIAFVLIKDFFNTKVRDKFDIKLINRIPIVASFHFEKINKKNNLYQDNQGSIIAESFRLLKTNLHFFESKKPIQTILVSSSISGEGKTFIARNLASFLTENNHKVVLVDFDLRKPDMHKAFNVKSNLGVTSYLINNATIDDIIIETSIPNLDLITVGPVAPNPTELILSENTNNFLDILRERYDYIIIDSSPIGIVSETYYLLQKVDHTIFTVRYNYSEKEMTNNTLDQIVSKNISNISIAINGLDKKTSKSMRKYGKNYYTS